MCLNALMRVRLSGIGVLDLLVAGAAFLAALSAGTSSAQALEANAAAAEGQWCVERADSGPPSCIYDNFLSCGVAALTTHGSCKARSSLPAAVTERKPATRTAHQRGLTSARNRTRVATGPETPDSSRATTLSSAKREKLFRDFVEWRRQHADR